ncbi:MAG TPA: GTPase HflX [Bacteroidota bacterium]|nr:GTPase HflX [Bacteroidota bacterium]
MISTAVRERAIIVGVATGAQRRGRVEDSLGELARLAESAGAEVVHRILQERSAVDAAFFIGKGKAEELSYLTVEKNIDLVIFDDDLSAVQVRNLEKLINCKIIDRSGIILDIFASRARTNESKTQVELAQLQYTLPRLTRQWTHLSKQFGGIGTKGPGETQIETDRRAIRNKIAHLRGRLRRIGKEREVQRKGRDRFPRVALVGYTNAGKSTLLNWFSGAGVAAEDMLFATLDSTVRLVALTPAHRVLLSDTVGFIRKLPHNLVASFQSTLDEVREADILLHVVDLSHPQFEEQIAVVNETLEEIGAQGKPTVMAFNKVDALGNRNVIPYVGATFANAVCIGAARGINMANLTERLTSLLSGTVAEETLECGPGDYDIVSRAHEAGEVLEERFEGDGVRLRVRMHRARLEQLKKSLAERRDGRRAP